MSYRIDPGVLLFVMGLGFMAPQGCCDEREVSSEPIAVTGVWLSPRSLALPVGSTSMTLVATITPVTATHQNVVWSSDDISVATVTQEGEVSPVAEGTATITVATEDGGFTDTCQVTVTIAATGVSLDQKDLNLTVGSPAATLVATVRPADATHQNVAWSSDDISVATVTQEGEVSPVAEGTATITVTTEDGGFTDTSTVEVHPTAAWVMSYFGPEQNLSADSLHLAYSTDGLHWRALNRGAPVYQLLNIGSNQIRDPFILRQRDGTFVYIATDWTRDDNDNYWSNPSPNIVVLESVDLIAFSNPRLLKVTDLSGPNGTPMHAWAPEAFWDPAREEYAILWSGNTTTDANRIYVTYTTDFDTVHSSTPDLFFDPGYSVIDATITQTGDRNYLFFKDETGNSGSSVTGSGKDIQIAGSSGPELTAGTFSRWDPDYITRGVEQSVRRDTEGPFVVEIPGEDRWYMYADYYLNGGVFGCWTTTDLDTDPSAWTQLSSEEYRLPPGVRHANTVRVTQAELDALLDHYGSSSLVRSTSSDCDGQPCYFSHSWFHGLVTHRTDRTDGQLADDFYWHIVPGLADPTDPDLVSLEAVGYPGSHARIDSQEIGRYPDCTSGANRVESLCDVPAAEQNHLVWVDAYEDSETYRVDATFRLVPALNGDQSMVSFQWYRDSTRYLRSIAFQMFAHVASSTEDDIDSSFAIE